MPEDGLCHGRRRAMSWQKIGQVMADDGLVDCVMEEDWLGHGEDWLGHAEDGLCHGRGWVRSQQSTSEGDIQLITIFAMY